MEKYKPTNIYVIECVDKDEINTMGAKALYDDVISKIKYTNSDIETEYFSVETKDDFLNTLDNICQKEIQDKKVLLHIYIHGDEQNGLQTNDEKFTSWKELREKCRKINIKTENRLFLVLANCHGSYIGLEIGSELHMKSPFNTVISSQYEEKIGDICELFQKFYQELLNGNDIIQISVSMEKDKNFYIKETKVLIECYLKYQKNKIGYTNIGIDVLKVLEEKIYNNFLFEEDRKKYC